MTRRLLLPAVCFAVAAVCLFGRLGSLPLIAPDEGRNAEVAREMKDAGAWLVPTYDGLPYLDKPALYFRLVALSMDALGENETAARLPAALAAVGVLALAWAFSRRAWGERAAALSVLVVGTTPLVIAFARIVIFDMVLALFVIAAILAAWHAEELEEPARGRWYVAAAACSAVAVLVKGPVGFILPLLVLVGFHLLGRDRAALRRVFAPLNILVFLLIVLPWFFGVALVRHDFPYYGLVEESFHRFTSPAFHRTAPVWYYAPVVLAVLFPWSILLPEAAVAAWRARARWTRADRLLVAWAVVVVLFFSISQSKLPGYVLTGVVALGLLTARVLDLAVEGPGRARRLVVRGAVILAVIAAAGAALLAAAHGRPGALPLLLHLRGGEWKWLALGVGPLLWPLAGLAVLAAAGAWRRDLRPVCAAFALPPLFLLTVAFGGVRAYTEADSGRALARSMPALAPTTELACLECLPNGVPFYLRRTMTLITRDGSETTSNYVTFLLRRSAAWPPGVVRLSDLGAWLAWRSRPAFVLADGAHRAALDSIASRASGRVAFVAPGWWGVALPAPPGL